MKRDGKRIFRNFVNSFSRSKPSFILGDDELNFLCVENLWWKFFILAIQHERDQIGKKPKRNNASPAVVQKRSKPVDCSPSVEEKTNNGSDYLVKLLEIEAKCISHRYQHIHFIKKNSMAFELSHFESFKMYLRDEIPRSEKIISCCQGDCVSHSDIKSNCCEFQGISSESDRRL